MSGKNGYFQLMTKEDGTYLRLYGPEEGGVPVLYDEVSNYLMDQNVYDFDKLVVGRALNTPEGTAEVKISSFLMPKTDESVWVEILEERMYARARFYPPANNGMLLSKDDIINALVRRGVKYGVDEEEIGKFLKERRYCTDYILARATAPVQGRDAKITYHFNTDLTLKPKRNEDGSVDFHQLDMISHCKKGGLLATLTPMEPGKPGIDVCGNIIRPLKVNNKVLRHGKNIQLSPDGRQMFSLVDGHVTLTDGRVFVSDTFEVGADVDASTGDIVYEGNVVVKGNVITGYSIHARGDIEVNGVVEGAYIEAGGQIVLKRGMQGMNKGVLKAGGNVISKFLENAEVISGGYVSTESILHCKISAQGDVIVGGKRGFVTGGEIRSASMISVRTAGSMMGTVTLLEVGIDPKIIEEFRELEKKIAVMMADKEKLAQALALFRKKLSMGAQISDEKKEYLKQVTQNNIMLEAQIREARKRYEDLKIQVDNNTSGIIKVSDIVYPGTKLTISNVNYFVRDEVHHSKFVRDRADIKVMPL
ncbi:MAG TPA: DUF342 domain-containing protein [Clostridiales bacterium]|nr:DUF342 domain-containing protein [Clostridiales bacterium]